jgi:hypothetical protein
VLTGRGALSLSSVLLSILSASPCRLALIH